MKILFITEFFPSTNELIFTGGVEAYNFYLIKELSKKHKITVICRRNLSSDKNVRLTNLKIIRIGKVREKFDTSVGTLPGRFLFSVKAIIEGLREDFDVVQGNNFVTYPIAFAVGFIKRKPKIAWFPDVFVGRWSNVASFFPAVIGEISERISLILPWDKIVSLSLSTSEKLISQKIDPQKIVTIYGGVDANFFSKIKGQRPKKFTICCIGRLVTYKRIDLLIKSAKILKDRGYDFKINIIGTGPEEYSLRLLVKQYNVEKNINFYSSLSRNKLGQILKSSHIFCLPSEEEGFGLVVIEAASCEVPYLVTDLPVLKEITLNGKGGLFFNKGSHKSLAAKIEIILKDQKLRKKLSTEAYLLSKNYSWPKIAKQFESVYTNLFQKKLKIVMLVDAWFPHVGGGQVHVWELSKKLSDLGCEIVIYTRDLGDWQEKHPNVIVKRVGHFKGFSNIFGRLEYLIRAQLFSLNENYDILHAHAFSPGLIAPTVKLFRQKKIIFTAHGKGMKINGLPFGEKTMENLVFYKIYYDGMITVSKNTITQKINSKKFIVLPNGVNVDEFKDGHRPRKSVKSILYVGRLAFDKGVDLLVEAFKSIGSREISLTIVGEGTEMDRLKKTAKNYKVKFTGKLTGPKLVDEFKKSDLFVLPSRVEGMPIRLLETWAAKVPVVATRVGDNSLYIKDGQTGFLANADSGSLKNAIERAINSNNLAQIAENSYKKVQNFTWEKVARKTKDFYLEVLNEGS